MDKTHYLNSHVSESVELFKNNETQFTNKTDSDTNNWTSRPVKIFKTSGRSYSPQKKRV